MPDPSTNEHAGWFRDVRKILDVSEVTPGLPLPHIYGTRAAFHYNGITHRKDAAEAVAMAETILSHALGVTFERREALAGDDTPRYILEAFMPSGLAVDIVARAGCMDDRDVPAPRDGAAGLAAVAA
jgi:hypothetical protein